MNARAVRIHHKERMKAKAIRIAKQWQFRNDPQNINGAIERNLVYNADNLKICSCWMCGNPRKFRGQKTLQELKFIGI